MGARDFQVAIVPLQCSPLTNNNNEAKKTITDVIAIASALQQSWPNIQPDFKALYNNDREIPLIYRSESGEFEILVMLSWEDEYVYLSLRFSYQNSQDIFAPFCDVAEWLMQQYKMYCFPGRQLAPTQDNQFVKPFPITEASQLRSILIPSMEYMRKRWQQWVT